jgi:hypothetical protein
MVLAQDAHDLFRLGGKRGSGPILKGDSCRLKYSSTSICILLYLAIVLMIFLQKSSN